MSGSSADDRALWARHAQELVGQVIGGKYRLESILGRGGMGTIYVAEQQPLGRKVALKVLHSAISDGGADPEFGKRFLLEAATLSQLSHPNIVVVHDYGQLDDDAAACFMAMELLDGKTITQVLGETGPIDPARALRITRDIARALRVAHEMSVIHRDLKPANVMLCQGPEGESVKVLDFGLAKVLRDDSEELTAEGRFLGSPRYMSPEQITKQPLDGRSDLYSLGVILFRMLVNVTPFAGDHAVQTLMAHLQEPVPRFAAVSDVPVAPPIEAMVRRLLEKDPKDRYADASALIAAIDALWPSLSEESLPQSTEMAVPSFARAASPAEPPPSESLSSLSLSSPSLPGPAAPEAAPTERHAGVPMWLVVLALAIAGGLAGVAGWMLVPPLVGAPDPTPDPDGAPSGDVVAAPDPGVAGDVDVTAEPPPVDPTFTLTIRSEPPGASVVRGEETLGQTPLEVALDSDELRQSPAVFTLALPGRAPQVLAVGPSDEDISRDVQLPELARVGRHGGRGAGARRGGGRRGGGGGGGGGGGDMSIKTSR